MKAVFLDRATFLDSLVLPAPQGISDYQVFATTDNDAETIISRAKDADIIITNKVRLSRDVLSQLPSLKLIQLTATGMDNVDKPACDEFGIVLKNVAGYSVNAVPEHTFMLMLSVMRAGRYYHERVADNSWQQIGKFCLLDVPILDLAGQTLGIIGKGAIGERVADIARAFGMNVLFAERQGQAPRNDDYTAFDDVLQRANVISLHCPLTPQTHHLINDATISQMTQKPVLINVARGAVVDSLAVARAVQDGRLSGYGSDVFEQEPLSADSPLLDIINCPRVLFTPHNAWGSVGAQQRLWDILSEQVSEFIKENI